MLKKKIINSPGMHVSTHNRGIIHKCINYKKIFL